MADSKCPLSMPSMSGSFFAASAVAMALGTHWLQTAVYSGRPDFFSSGNHGEWPNDAGYVPGQALQILVFFVLSPLAVAFLAMALLATKSEKVGSGEGKKWLQEFQKWFLVIFATVASFSVAVAAFFLFPDSGDLWACGYVECWKSGKSNTDPWGFRAAAGTHVIFVAVAAGILSLMMGFSQVSASGAPQAAVARRSAHLRRRLFSCGVLLAIPLWLIWICGTLPNSHHYMTKSGKGPDSFLYDFAVQEKGIGVSERENAVMSTLNLQVGERYFKIFPDTLLFYGYLELLLIGGVACSESPALQRLAKKRLWTMELSQILLASSLLVFYGLFTFYWAHDHAYHGGKPEKNTVWEVWARTMGVDASATLGLLLLPVSRSSPLLRAICLSFESALTIHKALGVLFLIFSVLHMVLYIPVFVENGHWQDVLPFNFGVMYTNKQTDNFTIGIMSTVFWPSIFIFGVLPWFRRRCWELFKFSHYMFLVLVPMTVLHGSNAWYFVLPGMCLWTADAIIRWSQAAEQVEVKKVETYAISESDGIVKLCFQWAGGRRQHSPGMFCWVNCPQISVLEWHPFSLSSSPMDEVQSLHIKSVFGESFTGCLYHLAGKELRFDGSNGSNPLILNIDGPYGPFVEINSPSVLLVAGGIGITAMLNLWRYILQGGPGTERVRDVHLVWVLRSMELANVLSSDLTHDTPEGNCRARVSLYCTGGEAMANMPPCFEIFQGRPALKDIIEEMTKGEEMSFSQSDGARLAVRACGTEGLMTACKHAVACKNFVDYEPWSFVM